MFLIIALVYLSCTIKTNSDEESSITLLNPSANEVLPANEYYTIEWESSNASDVVKLYYSINEQSTWNYIGMDDNDGAFDWYVPNSPTNDAFIKVEDNTEKSIYGINDKPFTISNFGIDEMHVSYPNGSETFTGTSTVSILWASFLPDSSMIVFHYSTDNGDNWNLIGYHPNSGDYSWVVPDVESFQCLVKIQSYDYPDISDISDAVFTIERVGGGTNSGLTLNYPNGGEDFNFNNLVNITWLSTGGVSSQVTLAYSTDNGGSYTTISTTVNDGSYNWTIPAVESNQYLIKISDAQDLAIYDISNDVFSVVSGQITENDSIYYDLYDDSSVEISFLGLGINIPFFVRMQFTPTSSFTLTHVRAAYRTEESANSISLSVQSVSTNEILYQASLSGNNYLSAEGDFFLLSIPTPITFLINEDFYIILEFQDVNYPMLLSDNGINGHQNRSSYSDDGSSWSFLQDALGDGNDDAWVIRAIQIADGNLQMVLPNNFSMKQTNIAKIKLEK
ncbi:MAG TPA: hypothetical protein ENH49_01850 [Candidatus Marinimicrobia bacterium]|nr:hypothetical protein [Candidatus Neomarinimicrobiota bacterium]